MVAEVEMVVVVVCKHNPFDGIKGNNRRCFSFTLPVTPKKKKSKWLLLQHVSCAMIVLLLQAAIGVFWMLFLESKKGKFYYLILYYSTIICNNNIMHIFAGNLKDVKFLTLLSEYVKKIKNFKCIGL